MDATTLIIHNCYDAFFEKMNQHFKDRHLIIRPTGEEEVGKKTRCYQHFTMHVHPNPNKLMRYHPEDLRIAYECKYNLTGDLQLYVTLRPFDKFFGAADFDPKRGGYLNHVDDIIRSFADAAPTPTCAIFKV